MTIDELYHHGILGQKWGKRNGPPYPLAPEKHSASEKEAGWKMSLKKGSKFNYKGGTAGGGAAEPDEEKEELEVKDDYIDENDPEYGTFMDIMSDPTIYEKYMVYKDEVDVADYEKDPYSRDSGLMIFPKEYGADRKGQPYESVLYDTSHGIKIIIPKGADTKAIGKRLKDTMEKYGDYLEKYNGKGTHNSYIELLKDVINNKEPSFMSDYNAKKNEKSVGKFNSVVKKSGANKKINRSLAVSRILTK